MKADERCARRQVQRLEWKSLGIIIVTTTVIITTTVSSRVSSVVNRRPSASGARGRFYNVVDLVNRLEAESRNGRQGRIADYLTRKDFAILDEQPHSSQAPVL